VTSREKLFEKLHNLTIKKGELETLLDSLGFKKSSGKGSHEKWNKKGFYPIVIVTHSKEIKPYQIKQVLKVLKAGGVI
jgi:predicted RNA binding protein YcfA (HicA-like mRNA interferase family)